MISLALFSSPVGELTLAARGEALVGLWLEGQRYFGAGLEEKTQFCPTPVLDAARNWLEAYFEGSPMEHPGFPLEPKGTLFQQQVWKLLLEIPYGETVTYGELAACLEKRLGRKTSSRAVGSAVGRNPISILVPCHRVVGKGGALTGYAGGLERKEWLLRLEHVI